MYSQSYPCRQYLILDRHLETPRLLHLKLHLDMFIHRYLIMHKAVTVIIINKYLYLIKLVFTLIT